MHFLSAVAVMLWCSGLKGIVFAVWNGVCVVVAPLSSSCLVLTSFSSIGVPIYEDDDGDDEPNEKFCVKAVWSIWAFV